jgi:hypothetical protein
VLSLAATEARISNVSPTLSEPLRASSPARRATGIGSPLSAASSIHRAFARDDAINGDDFPGLHKNIVTDHDLLDGYLLDDRCSQAMGNSWSAIDK